MSATEKHDVEILDSVLPRYRAEGFDVYVNPSPSILPPFMQSYRPDAIALKPERKIAIEVVRPMEATTRKVQDLKSLFAPHSDWELRLVYISPSTSDKGIEVVSLAAIRNSIQRVKDLRDEGHFVPALVMAWATLEAVGRALLPGEFRRPQTPGRLIEVLAEQGYLTPREADTLRPAISLRNAAVHGNLDANVNAAQLDNFIAILQTLVEILSKEHSDVG